MSFLRANTCWVFLGTAVPVVPVLFLVAGLPGIAGCRPAAAYNPTVHAEETTESQRDGRTFRAVRFSPQLDRVFLYANLPEGQSSELPDIRVSVGGHNSHLVGHAIVPQHDGVRVLCLEVEPSTRLRNLQRVDVEMLMPDGLRWAARATVFNPPVVGVNEYAFPLRIVGVSWMDDWVRLRAYNESNEFKPDLVIDRVLVDGLDATSKCRLPEGPLPADKHDYEQDERNIDIPLAVLRTMEARVEIDFHLLPARRGPSSAFDQRVRRQEIRVRKDLIYPIGISGSCYLRDCVSVHNGGMRHPIGVTKLREAAQQARQYAGDQPVYANLIEGVSPDLVRGMAPSCDFLVIAASPYLRASSDPVDGVFDYYSQIRESTPHFITSVTKESSGSLTAGDARWLTMAALAAGGRGILLPIEMQQENDAAPPSLLDATTTELAALTSFLTPSHYVSIPVTTSADGIHVGTLLSGPDQLLVFVLNQWTTRMTRLEAGAFYGVPRDVQLTLSLGEHWIPDRAVDLGNGARIELISHGDGQVGMKLPALRVGRVLLLQRTNATQLAVSPIAAFAEPEAPTLDLEPTAAPFVKLGGVEVDSSHHIRIPLRNRSSHPITVTASDMNSVEAANFQIQTEACELAAAGEGELRVRIVPTRKRSPFVARLVVSAKGSSLEGFEAFIDGETCEVVRATPMEVDFDTISGDPKKYLSKVQLWAGAENIRIARIDDIVSPTPITSEIDQRELVIRFAPRPEKYGPFKGEIAVDVQVQGEERLRRLVIPYAGRYMPDIWAEPAQLVVPRASAGMRRQIRIKRGDGTPFSIEHTSTSRPWLKLSPPDGIARSEHVLQIDLQTTGDCDDAAISILCGGKANHADFTLEVPVRVVGGHSTDGKENVGEVFVKITEGSEDDDSPMKDDSPVKVVAKRVNAIASVLRTEGLQDPTMGNWLLMHALLMFGDTAYDDAQNRPQLQKLFTRLLKPDSQVRFPPFTLRRGKPIPVHEGGDRFDLEHHRDQFLAYMSLAGVPTKAALNVRDQSFTVQDLLDQSLFESGTAGELSWTVSAYAHYLPAGHRWKNKFNKELSLAELTKALLEGNERKCGGSHRLLSLARVLSRPELAKDPEMSRLWKPLQLTLDEECRRLAAEQRPDGSFQPPRELQEKFNEAEPSTPYLNGVYYTGHTLEWMAVGLPAQRLREPWVVRAVDYLAKGLEEDFRFRINTGLRSEEERYAYGYMCHALSGLHRWVDKVSDQPPGTTN